MRTRIIRLLLATLGIACSVSAHASIIQIDYDAVVGAIRGNGLGKTVGQSFAGQYFIDTNAVDRTWYNCGSVPTTDYDNCSYTGANLINGSSFGTSLDHVDISDRLHPTCYQCEFDTEFLLVNDAWMIDDGVTRLISYNYLHVFDAEIDFIHGSDLEQTFELFSSQLSYYGNMYGRAGLSMTALDGTEIFDHGYSFAVTHLRVATVPEPGTLGLMALGIAATGWAGRRRRQSRRS